jgi:RimJ/RimL family protein N-acetyltransferase
MSDEEPKQQRLILVQGKRVGLGALRHDLIPAYLRWRSDPEVMRGTGESSRIPTVAAMQAWYEQATSPGNREVHFTIYDLDDVAPVGTALLVRVDQHAGTAEFGLTTASGVTRASAPRQPGWCSTGPSPSWACTTSCW